MAGTRARENRQGDPAQPARACSSPPAPRGALLAEAPLTQPDFPVFHGSRARARAEPRQITVQDFTKTSRKCAAGAIRRKRFLLSQRGLQRLPVRPFLRIKMFPGNSPNTAPNADIT